MISRFAVAASLALALAACGSSNQPTSQSTETVTSTTAAVPETGSSEAAPSAAPSTEAATPSPTPTPSPSATPTAKASTSAMQSTSAMSSAAAAVPTAFNQCAACHSTTPGKTIIGPSLAGVYGTKAGQVAGFQFSDAMKNSGLVLNEKGLDRFLADPKGTVPGTIMAFAGIKDHEQREDVIDYLKTLK